MSTLPSIFDTCKPRADVEAGTTKDEQFAADLAQVVNGTAPKEYSDAATFFRHSFPTRGMKDLLQAVCKRLSGKGGEIASIIRLDTQYGGGKTHGLIALTHAVRGMQGVENPQEFIDPSILPEGDVRVAALDGENADPADGLTLEEGVRAYSLWGELAYRIAGIEGYRRVENADKKHIAPGAETIRELFGGKPTLIMLDEVSVYLRKVEEVHPGASQQFTAFIQALFKAVESSPKVALVLTLAVGKDAQAKDAYKAEHERAMNALAEAESVVSRKATQLNPTEEDETAEVLKRRLFDEVDSTAAAKVVAEYARVWAQNQGDLPPNTGTIETKELFLRGYPLHPEALNLLTEKLASLNNFHRTRGMLRLLARTVHQLWKTRPADAQAIHPHHIDVGYGPIRDEVTTRLGQGDFAPAIKADVAAVKGDDPATSQSIDAKHYPGQLPITSYIARTVFLNTLAYGDSAKGITPDHLKFSVCSPQIEPSFIEQARIRFVQEALYLDDRPGAPMRFMVEPNLEAMIRRIMRDEIDSSEVRVQLQERIRELFGGKGAFELVPFPSGSYEVDDTIGDGRPRLVALHYDALSINDEPQKLPPMIEEIVKYKGADQKLRELLNNLVFVVADQRAIPNMQDRIGRALAIKELLNADRIRQLAPYQQEKVKEENSGAGLKVAGAILQCYRHVFFPYHHSMPGSDLPIAHAVVEGDKANANPGDGQKYVARVLRDHSKLLGDGDTPEAPAYVRDQTPLKQKGEITTLDLRNEYRRAPKLSMLLTDTPLVSCIRDGINSEVFIYREGDQVWGKGDPAPTIQISDNAFVHTLADAKKKKLWPRPEPMSISLAASPSQIEIGGQSELTVAVTGGNAPYTFSGSDPGLFVENSTQTVLRCPVSPATTETYQVEVKDSRGQRQTATTKVTVIDTGKLAVRLWAIPSQLTLGQTAKINLTIHGGKAPFQLKSSLEEFTLNETTNTSFQCELIPSENVSHSIEVVDSVGNVTNATMDIHVTIPKRPELSAEGPLSQALVELWEKARKAKVTQIESLVIKLYDAAATWKLHQALATLKDAEVRCEYEVDISAEGIDSFQVEFSGLLTKANALKSFLDPQLKSASDHDFTGTYQVEFHSPLSAAPDKTDSLTKSLTRYGSGEAYVEAHAAPVEESR